MLRLTWRPPHTPLPPVLPHSSQEPSDRPAHTQQLGNRQQSPFYRPLQGDTGQTLSPVPAPGAPRSGSWTVDPTLLLSPIFQLHPKSLLVSSLSSRFGPSSASVWGSLKLALRSIRTWRWGGGQPVDWQGSAHMPAAHTQFMGHGQWRRPSAPLHFIKKEERRNTNKQRLHGDHTHGTGRQGQAITS